MIAAPSGQRSAWPVSCSKRSMSCGESRSTMKRRLSVWNFMTAVGFRLCHSRQPVPISALRISSRTAALKITGLPGWPATHGTTTDVPSVRFLKA